MAETPPTPTFPTDALAEQLRGIVREEVQASQQQGLARVEQHARQQEAQAAHAQRATAAAQQWSDPVGQTLAPYLAPVVQQLTFEAKNAGDRADFYSMHEEAKPYRDEIEALFANAAAQRNPQARESLWYYWRGRNSDRFAKDEQARTEAQTKQITQTGAVLGPSLHLDNRPISMDDFRRLSPDDMERALAGTTF